MYKGVTTSELDELAAETAANLASLHPDFGVLAARIAVSNLHKSTLKSFSETATLLYNYVEPRTGKLAPMLADDVYEFIQKHASELNGAIVYDRDFGYDYFGRFAHCKCDLVSWLVGLFVRVDHFLTPCLIFLVFTVSNRFQNSPTQLFVEGER